MKEKYWIKIRTTFLNVCLYFIDERQRYLSVYTPTGITDIKALMAL